MTQLRQHKRLDDFPTCKNHISFQFERYEKLVANLVQEFERLFADFHSNDMAFRLFGSPYFVIVEDVPVNFLDGACWAAIWKLPEAEISKCRLNQILHSVVLPPAKYPTLRKNALKLMSLFGSTFTCGQTFSRMKSNKSAHMQNLGLLTIVCTTSCRISVSEFNANEKDLAFGKQAQVLHWMIPWQFVIDLLLPKLAIILFCKGTFITKLKN